MRILVCFASRHGATEEIAGCIARELQRVLPRGHDTARVDIRHAHQVATDAAAVEEYDAVVIGSALYMGKWLPQAQAFVTAHARTLESIPVWLFSSGPLGDPPVPAEGPAGVRDLITLSKAREHRLFGGRLDRRALGFGERAIARAVRAPEGDFRDWAAITGWADSIAQALTAEHAH